MRFLHCSCSSDKDYSFIIYFYGTLETSEMQRLVSCKSSCVTRGAFSNTTRLHYRNVNGKGPTGAERNTSLPSPAQGGQPAGPGCHTHCHCQAPSRPACGPAPLKSPRGAHISTPILSATQRTSSLCSCAKAVLLNLERF